MLDNLSATQGRVASVAPYLRDNFVSSIYRII
jgi:hypothetical protein